MEELDYIAGYIVYCFMANDIFFNMCYLFVATEFFVIEDEAN